MFGLAFFWRGQFWRAVTWCGVVWCGEARFGMAWRGVVRMASWMCGRVVVACVWLVAGGSGVWCVG